MSPKHVYIQAMKVTWSLVFVLFALNCFSQNRNSVWCFGDSAMIGFSDTSNIIVGSSNVRSRGSCASICDSTGELLFYAGYDDDVYTIGGDPFKNGEIYNKQHQTMQNGDSIVMQLWYKEVVIINGPGDNNLYYVFSIGVTGGSADIGLYYSVIDMTLDSGRGAVVQKNILLNNFESCDGLVAIKHGNGRDWWIFYKRWDFVNNTIYRYLVSPSGVSNLSQQNIGDSTDNSFTQILFSNGGDKAIIYNYTGMLQLCDFDRCSGFFSNTQSIYQESSLPPWRGFWGATFSPNDSILYISSLQPQAGDTGRLYQWDLKSANISGSIDTLWETSDSIQLGHLKLAPDKKIYLSSNFYGGYPYGDTAYYTSNMNLSVINDPNVLGAGCNLQPFSFYLGGKRCYYGLPNNPDYELGSDSGSMCDTLDVGLEALIIPKTELHIFYHSGWKTAFINAQGLISGKYDLSVFDVSGKQIFIEQGSNNGSYFTKSLNCTSFANGLYIVSIVTCTQHLTNRLLVY